MTRILEPVYCQGLVSPKYVRTDSSKSVEYLIFGSVASGRPVRKGREPKRDIKGFLIGNTTEIPEFLYVDVVCANYPGLGDLMVGRGRGICKTQRIVWNSIKFNAPCCRILSQTWVSK